MAERCPTCGGVQVEAARELAVPMRDQANARLAALESEMSNGVT